jgi:hypothetical protein
MWGTDLRKQGLPCHVTFCTLFTVLDEDMNIVYSAGYFKTVSLNIVPILSSRKSYPFTLREVKDTYCNVYKKEVERLLRFT